MQRALWAVRSGAHKCTADGSPQMTEPMTDTIEAEMKVSPFRRWFSSGLVALTGALLLNMAMTSPPASLIGQGLVWAMAALLLIAALKLWRDTGESVRLVGARLEDSHGGLIVRLEDVATVTRTHFSFRPSNGFMLDLTRDYDPRWCMGLYWCAGKRAAFGGATSGAEAKKLAEAIERHLGQSGGQL